MRISFDLHTHTRYSHGKGTVWDNARAALASGISLGIADHGPGHVYFGVRENGMRRMLRDIEAFPDYRDGFSLLQGIEANLMDAKGKTDLDDISPPQFALMGFHKGIFPKSALSVSLYAQKLFAKERARTIVTDALIQAIIRYPIDAITHPGEYVDIDMAALAAACADMGVLIELNNKHPLSVSDARTALETGAHFLLSSDAHQSAHVGRVDRAIDIALRAEIPPTRIVNVDATHFFPKLRISRVREKF